MQATAREPPFPFQGQPSQVTWASQLIGAGQATRPPNSRTGPRPLGASERAAKAALFVVGHGKTIDRATVWPMVSQPARCNPPVRRVAPCLTASVAGTFSTCGLARALMPRLVSPARGVAFGCPSARFLLADEGGRGYVRSRRVWSPAAGPALWLRVAGGCAGPLAWNKDGPA